MIDCKMPKREVIIKEEELTVSMTAADEVTFTGEFHDQGDNVEN
jgi:hypothetical protein